MNVLQQVLALKPQDRVKLYYDLMNSKSAVYDVVSVSLDRVVYQSSSQVMYASPDYVAKKLVAVL